MAEMNWSENALGDALRAPWGLASVAYSFRDGRYFVVGRLEGKGSTVTLGRYDSPEHAKQKAADWLAMAYFDVQE